MTPKTIYVAEKLKEQIYLFALPVNLFFITLSKW